MGPTVIDLSGDMGSCRVIDFAALVDGSTVHNARITINRASVERRVVAAPALLTVVAETGQVGRGVDGWHSEGAREAASTEHAMAVLYTGDRKCSSSTFWNTGNPRNLVELLVSPLAEAPGWRPGRHPRALWRWLADRHEPVSRALRFGVENPWFRAAPEALLDDMRRFVRDGGDPFASREQARSTEPRDMLYLLTEEGGGFVKLGKCKGLRTSPPERRVGMYAAGNPRSLAITDAWLAPEALPERQLQAALRRACVEGGVRHRAEWFELSVERARAVLAPLVRQHGLTALR